MVKIVHFADTHLGVETHGRLDPHTGLSTRLGDFLTSFDAIVDAALRVEADLVIFAGDAYKTRRPSPTLQREFASRILHLSRAKIPIVLVTGNHDILHGVGQASTMEIFHTLGIEHVYVASKPDVLDIETRHGLVQVGVLPWVFRSALPSSPKYKNEPLEKIDDLLLERSESLLTGEQGLTSLLCPDVPHILAAHATVQGAVYGSERSVMLGKEIVLPMSMVKDQAWDYVALGHIHKHQALEADRSPPVVYSGSIERVDFGEEKDAKGFIIADIERGNCAWQFERLDTRNFVTISIHADSDDPTGQIVQAIERAEVEGATVRVVIRTTAKLNALIKEREVRRALVKGGAFYIAPLVQNVVRPERIRIGLSEEAISAMTPLDVLEKFLQTKEVPPKRITVLRHHAETLAAKEVQ